MQEITGKTTGSAVVGGSMTVPTGNENGGRIPQFGIRGIHSGGMSNVRHSVGAVPKMSAGICSEQRDVTFGGPTRSNTLKAVATGGAGAQASSLVNRSSSSSYSFGVDGVPVRNSGGGVEMLARRPEAGGSEVPLHRRLSQLSGEQLQLQKPELDLREVDGKVTREVEAGGVVVERRYKVMWDQRQQINERDLTDDHRIVGVKVDHHKVVVQPKLVTVTEAVNGASHLVQESSPLRQARCNSTGKNSATRSGAARVDSRAM